MTHACHWPGCDKEVPPKLWGCKPHWFKLPARLRQLINAYIAITPTAATPRHATQRVDDAELVERAARAIYAVDYCKRDNWHEKPESMRELYRQFAKAAIAAMSDNAGRGEGKDGSI